MKKRGLCLLLALGMVLGLCACTKAVRGKDSAQEVAVASCTALAAGDGEAYVALAPDSLASAIGITEEEMARNIEDNTRSWIEQLFGGTGKAEVEVLSTQNHTGSELDEAKEGARMEFGLEISAWTTVECQVTVNGQTDTMSVDTFQVDGRWYVIGD